MADKRWNIDKAKLASKDIAKMHARYDAAKGQMAPSHSQVGRPVQACRKRG